VAELVLGEPKLRIRKGVVAANEPQAAFLPNPPTPMGVIFHPPGTSPGFSGVINSTNVGIALNSDVSNVDGCDRLRFVIAVENLGTSPRGAFDVKLADLLPACLVNPSHLRVVNGLGAPFHCNGGQSCSNPAFFSSGITLDDTANAGALAPYSPTAGTNIAIITFDATIPCGIAPTGCCTNTAKLLNYAGANGGPNHVTANFSTPFPDTTNTFSDNARVCIQPQLAKSIVATSEPSVPGSQGTPLLIGEIVRYRMQIAVPVGVSPALSLKDTLPPGLAWMPGGCQMTFKDPALILFPPTPVFSGTNFTPTLMVNFGKVTNPSTGSNGALLVVECNALVLNSPPGLPPNNQSGNPRPNSFTTTITPLGGPPVTFTSNTVPAVIAEPAGGLVKQEIATSSPATAIYQLSYTNTGTASAFDVLIQDPLPASLVVSSSSVTVTPSSCTLQPITLNTVSVTCPVVPVGGSVKVQFSVSGVSLCTPVTNTATLTYTSLPGPHGTLLNPTGAFPPGASGAPRGERVYSSSASLVTQHCPDLGIDKSHTAIATCGQPFSYLVVVTNLGNASTAGPVMVQDNLPAGLTFVSGGGSGWSCSAAGSAVTCSNPAVIPPGTGSTLTLTVLLSCPSGVPPASITNCATVTTSPELNLGNNQACDSTSPAAAAGCVVAIAAGGSHSLAVRSDHTALAWGQNTYGKLGDGSMADHNKPVPVNGLSGVAAVAGGVDHTLALLQNGTVWAWGRNDVGMLGNGTFASSALPVQVKGLGGNGLLTNVVAIAAGGYHSLALLANGTVVSWGLNSNGQLGNGATGVSNVPVQVTGLNGAVAIAGGTYHSLALLSNGTVLAWGNNNEGEVGNGTITVQVVVPVAVKNPAGTGVLSGVRSIASGLEHSLALLTNGTVVTWGLNSSGQLGNGTTVNSSLPVPVSGIGGSGTLSGVAAVSGGFNHSLALLSSGGAVAWGSGSIGQLGNGSFTSSKVPVVVTGLAGATAIAAGGQHSLALLADGTVHAWGYDGNGQLGDGVTGIAENVPVKVLTPCLQCTPPPSGMKGWWPLDELSGTTAADIVGGFNGSYVGTPVPVPSGEVGPALLANSTNHVQVPWTSGFPFDFHGGDFTIDAWVLYKSGGSGTGELWVVDRGFSFHFAANPFTFSPPHLAYACGIAFWPNPIPFDTWTHIAVTVTPGTPGGLKQYVNGQLVGQKNTCAYNISFPNVPLGIAGGMGSDFNEVDEVEIFSRVLTDAEILAIYKAGSAGKCK
jgi:uncharacterized repeat protein (TIGR01451 family)